MTEQRFGFPFEVLISDNASQDDTPQVVGDLARRFPQLRYIRQTRNVGSEPNMVAAYRQAVGEFTMYLADDDLLIPDAVETVVDYLDAHPNIAVCYAPWEMYDDVAKQTQARWYEVERETIFTRATALDLANFIVQRHVFPEIFVYRSEALRKIMYNPLKIFWAFAHLAHVLNHGDVAFLPTVFYRSVTRHWEGETRTQEGNTQVKSEWDLYRGGIEYLMLQAFRYAGFAEIPPDQRQVVHQMVQAFVDVRMKVALRLLMHSKEFLRAHEVYARLIANSALTTDEIGSYRGSLPSRAALQALAETFHSITRVRSLVIFQTADPAAIQQLMAEVDNSVPIGNFDDTPPEEIADKECYFVLCGNENQRTRLVDAGFPPGQVWAEGELLRQFNL